MRRLAIPPANETNATSDEVYWLLRMRFLPDRARRLLQPLGDPDLDGGVSEARGFRGLRFVFPAIGEYRFEIVQNETVGRQ